MNELSKEKQGNEANTLLPAVYPLIDNHRWYAENGTVYNEADEEVRIVLLHNSGRYSNLPQNIAEMIASALNSRQR
jgi:hypothetical protein